MTLSVNLENKYDIAESSVEEETEWKKMDLL
jgi:hypothetical protein